MKRITIEKLAECLSQGWQDSAGATAPALFLCSFHERTFSATTIAGCPTIVQLMGQMIAKKKQEGKNPIDQMLNRLPTGTQAAP